MIPEWLEPVREGASTITGGRISRFLPPADGSARPGAVLMLFSEGEQGGGEAMRGSHGVVGWKRNGGQRTMVTVCMPAPAGITIGPPAPENCPAPAPAVPERMDAR